MIQYCTNKRNISRKASDKPEKNTVTNNPDVIN